MKKQPTQADLPTRPRPARAERTRDFYGRAWLSCMRCGQLFWSLWPGHRHCERCQHKINELSGGLL